MNKKIKLHLCCGDVYISSYINCDIKGKLTTKVSKEELEANLTTLNNYFKYEFGTPRRDVIVDCHIDLLKKWPIKDNIVNEIVMISCIEHFTLKEAQFIVSEMKRVLKVRGKVVIDFPNIKKDITKYHKVNDEFMMELIYCNGKDTYSHHKWGYTKKTFQKLMEGFEIKWKKIVLHDYPMIGAICIKKED